MSLLGAMILDNSKIEIARKYELNESHFTDSFDRVILREIYKINDKGKRVEYANLLPNLRESERRKRKKDEIEERLNWNLEYAAGGEFTQEVSRTKFYAKRNALIGVSQYLKEFAKDKDETPASVAISAISELKKISEPANIDDEGDTTEALDSVADIINNGQKKGSYIETGLKSLDNIIMGYKMGELYMVTAATGQGKSAFMTSLSCSLGKKSISNCYFALEMSRVDMLIRIVANIGRIDSFRLQQGKYKMTQAEREKANVIVAGLYERDFSLFDPSGIEVYDLCEKIKAKASDGCKVFFVDQLELIDLKADNKIDRLTGIVRMLRQLAKDLHVCIVLAHQPNMAAQKRAEQSRGEEIPTHNDMRDAPVANDPAIVLVMHRKESYAKEKTKAEDKGTALVKVSKNRLGKVGICRVGFSPEHSRFYDLY